MVSFRMTATVLRTGNSFLTMASADSSSTPTVLRTFSMGNQTYILSFLHLKSQTKDGLSFKDIF